MSTEQDAKRAIADLEAAAEKWTSALAAVLAEAMEWAQAELVAEAQRAKAGLPPTQVN